MKLFGRVGPPGGQLYIDEGKKQEELWQESRTDPSAFVHVKAVIVFEGDHFEPAWRLRRQEISGLGPVITSLSALGTEGEDKSSGCSRARAGEGALQAAITEIGASMRLEMARLVSAYEGQPGAPFRREILQVLHRIQIYATALAFADSAVELPTSGGAPIVRNILEFSRGVHATLRAHDAAFFDGTYQASVLKKIRRIANDLRQISASISDITEKLATKTITNRRGQIGPLKERVEQLVDQGLRRIGRETPVETIRQFYHAFLLASRVFASRDLSETTKTLDRIAGKVVEGLGNLRTSGHFPLLDLFVQLAKRAITGENTEDICIVGAFLRNDCFHRHLEGLPDSPNSDTLDEVVKNMLSCQSSILWRGGARLLIRRPPRAFQSSLNALVSANRSIEDIILQYIFRGLNRNLVSSESFASGGVESTRASDDYCRHRIFLEHLADANAMHLLGAATATDEALKAVAQSLTLIYNLDTHDPGRVKTFLSNAGFLAARKFAFDHSSIRRAVDAVLAQAGANPVEDLPAFERHLDIITAGHASELPSLRERILEALGESIKPGVIAATSSAPTRLRSVETVLAETVLPDCHRILELVLGCYPLAWRLETFLSPISVENKLVIDSTGRLSVAAVRGGLVHLRPAFLRGEAGVVEASRSPDPSATYFSASGLRQLSADDVVFTRDGHAAASIKSLVVHYGHFKALRLDGEKMDKLRQLLGRILACMRAHSPTEWKSSPGQRERNVFRLRHRVEAVGEFFRDVASFSRVDLEEEARRRFFIDGEITEHGKAFIRKKESERQNSLSDPQTAVVDRLFEVSCDTVRSIIDTASSEDGLTKGIGQIDVLVRRELDTASFNTEVMVASFNQRHAHESESRSTLQLDAKKTDDLRVNLYKTSQKALEARGCKYIMPNQALAIALLQHEQLKEENVFLKMGTGQGKSIVIAATALNEARSLGDGQHVFVLTAYDHLALRDHALGRAFFAAHGLKSACITQTEDLDKLTADVKVVYADAKTLQNVVISAITRLVDDLLTAAFSPAEVSVRLSFLHRLYEQRHRFILDEHDLILEDLDYHRGFVMPFEPSAIDKKFMKAHRAYSPFLTDIEKPAAEAWKQSTDLADGKVSRTVSGAWIERRDGSKYFNLRPGALRVSMMLKQADRVVGLSGSAEHKNVFRKVEGLQSMSAKFFEVPSSRDPSTFGTRIVNGSKDELRGLPGIWCTRDHQDCESDDVYIESVVSDVRAVRVPRDVPGTDGQTTSRPVLVFADPNDEERFAKLRHALMALGAIADFQEILTAEDLDEKGLKGIGVPGKITLATSLCGRGADIIVSPKVPDSLHVVVATNLPSTRLLIQLIGRTGRMGRDGSYAIITRGKCVVRHGRYDRRAEENLLHHLSSDLVKLAMTASCDRNKCRQWLMRASQIYWANAWDDHEAIDSCWKKELKK